MKETILSKYSVESNGETVTVRVIQTEKGVKVEIDGKTPDVFVNNVEVYSLYDKEEYKYIPSNIRSFIEKNLYDYEEGVRIESKEVHADLEIDGTSFLAILSINKAKNKKNELTLRDWIIEYSMLEDSDIKVKNGKENFEAFKKAIKDLGCEIRLSHCGNDYDNWYDLVVPINEFNEEKVLECVKLWNEYNQNLISKYLNGRY